MGGIVSVIVGVVQLKYCYFLTALFTALRVVLSGLLLALLHS